MIRWVCAILLGMMTMTGMTAEGSVTKKDFGKLPDGTSVDLYTLKAGKIEVSLTTYGARVVSVMAPDKNGIEGNVVLGYDSLDGYLAEETNGKKTYFGAVVGRYGNRIAGGKFTIDGKQYQASLNNKANSLHGGTVGFDQKVWTAKQVPNGVEFTLVSPDGDQGYPGTLTAHVKYTLEHDALKIEYTATTDKATVVNLTNHSYFNLAGSGEIVDEDMMIPADSYTPVDSGLIPTGIEPVEGTPFDFRKSTRIGKRIDVENEQLAYGGGYDHNWVLNGTGMKLAAKAVDPASGRTLTVTTTEPGVQFYTGNSMIGPIAGHGGVEYPRRGGFCLETQHFPDSPNHPAFPTTLLEPGQTMHSTTVFTFGVQGK